MKLIKEINEDIKVSVINEGTENPFKNYFIEGVFLQSNIKNRNGRVYPVEILTKEVNRYVTELVNHNRAFGELSHPECNFSSNFDVLTAKGWKPFLSLSVGELILTRTREGKIEEQPIQAIINEPYNGHGYHIECRNINSSFTPNHRFYLKDRYGNLEIATLEEIYNNRTKFNKHTIIKTGKWEGNSPENITLSAYNPHFDKQVKITALKNDPSIPLNIDTKTFCQLLGIWSAEGHISKHQIHISQNAGEKCDKIEEMLKNLPIPYTKRTKINKYSGNNRVVFTICDYRLWKYFKELGNKYTKYIPYEIKQLDSVFLDELIAWFVMGDGRKKGNFSNLFSVSKRLVEDLHECLIKAGGSGNWTVIYPDKDYEFAGRIIQAKNKVPLYQLNISTCDGIYLDERFVKITKVEHSGNVYCLTVPNSNFYMKENNKAFWTGNSSNINLERASHIIKELRQEGSNFIGKAKIIDTPYGKIVKNLIDEGAKLGVSSRGIGTLQEKNGVQYVTEDFRLATAADIVADPSAPDAFVRGIMENVDWIYVDGKGYIPQYIDETKKHLSNIKASRITEQKKLEVFEKYLKLLEKL